MRFAMAVCAVALVGCTKPEGGLKLTYSNGAGSRAVVEKRVHTLGAKGAEVTVQGDGLEVRLPGGRKAAEVKQSLHIVGRLEFSYVVEGEVAGEVRGVSVEREPEGTYLSGPARDAVEAAAKTATLPQGRVLVSADPRRGFRTWVVEEKPALSGDTIAEATASVDQMMNAPMVNVTFTAAGKQAFADATEKGVGRRLAIILDGEVTSAPTVQEKIPGGVARISFGARSKLEEAEAIAAAFQSGVLSEPLVLATEDTYGPPAK